MYVFGLFNQTLIVFFEFEDVHLPLVFVPIPADALKTPRPIIKRMGHDTYGGLFKRDYFTFKKREFHRFPPTFSLETIFPVILTRCAEKFERRQPGPNAPDYPALCTFHRTNEIRLPAPCHTRLSGAAASCPRRPAPHPARSAT